MFGTRKVTGLSSPVRFFCALVLGSISAFLPAAAETLPVIRLQVGNQPVTAEVAADDASRSRGLMFRESLPPNHGMLFVFPETSQYCFWMKNTPLPLSIAFISARGEIINLADMEPLALDAHCALAPARYALEMEQGWFAKNSIRPGSRITGLP